MTMLVTALKIAAGLVVGYLVIVALAWRFQEKLAFPAPNSPEMAPADVGIADGERVDLLTTDGVRLAGWYLPPEPGTDKPAPGLLWFYGNMETMVDVGPLLRELRPPGVGVLIIDYRGYGQSEGRTTEAGLYRDGQAAWDFLSSRAEIDSTAIVVYGRSLGSAVALSLATRNPVRGVILDSPFTSARDMSRRHYPWAPPFALRLKMDNLSRAAELNVPLLVFHGEDDFIAPTEMGKAVAAAAPESDFVRIDGAGHNDTYTNGGTAYRQRMWQFLEEVGSRSGR